MLQISYDEIREPDAAELDALRAAFADRHYVHLRGFIERGFLDQLLARIQATEFVEDETSKIGCVEHCADPRVDHAMQYMINQPPILRTVSAIVDRPVSLWIGRTVRRVPGRNHYSNWHNDATPPVAWNGRHYRRVVPLSLNLSTGRFQGGNLEMRTVPEHEVFADIENKGPGDALMFRIGEDLQHRVADVTGGTPRLVHVGWFHEPVAEAVGAA